MRQRLDCVRDRVVVLRRAQRLERLAGIALGHDGLPLLGEQSRLRPVEPGARIGLGHVTTGGERLRDDALGRSEVATVGERVAEHRGETDVLQDVRRFLVRVDAPLQQRDRRTQLAGRRVRTREALGDRRVLDRIEPTGLERFLQQLDRVAGPALVQRHLAEAAEGQGALGIDDRAGARGLVQLFCRVEVVETQCQLRLEERRSPGVGSEGTGREVVGVDVEAPTEAAQELEGRGAVAGLDARDVRARAPADGGECRLTQTGAFARSTQSPPHSHGLIDVA